MTGLTGSDAGPERAESDNNTKIQHVVIVVFLSGWCKAEVSFICFITTFTKGPLGQSSKYFDLFEMIPVKDEDSHKSNHTDV